MANYDWYAQNITVNNCNGRLTNLYKIRDKVGERIDKLIWLGYSTEEAEQEYNKICDVIEELCKFRRNNPGCLTEGDPGFSWG